MRVEDDHRTTARSFAHRDQIAGRIVVNVVETIFAQQAFDVFRARLLMTGRRIDLGDGNPFAQDTVVIAIDEIVGGFEVRASGERLHLINVFSDRFDLRANRN